MISNNPPFGGPQIMQSLMDALQYAYNVKFPSSLWGYESHDFSRCILIVQTFWIGSSFSQQFLLMIIRTPIRNIFPLRMQCLLRRQLIFACYLDILLAVGLFIRMWLSLWWGSWELHWLWVRHLVTSLWNIQLVLLPHRINSERRQYLSHFLTAPNFVYRQSSTLCIGKYTV